MELLHLKTRNMLAENKVDKIHTNLYLLQNEQFNFRINMFHVSFDSRRQIQKPTL